MGPGSEGSECQPRFSPQERCLRLSAPTYSSPNSTKNAQLVGRCEGDGPSPVLGKQYTHFMNGSLAVISSSFSRPFIQQVVSEPDPGACFADFRGRHCPVHSLFQRRPRRVNEQRANGQDCVTVGALVCWVRGQVRVTLGLFQRDLYWRCHLSPDPAEAGLSLRHGSSAWVTRPGRALAGAFLTSFSSSPSHQGSQTRIPPLLFVDAGSGSKGFLAPPPAVCASPLLPEAAGSPCS